MSSIDEMDMSNNMSPVLDDVSPIKTDDKSVNLAKFNLTESAIKQEYTKPSKSDE